MPATLGLTTYRWNNNIKSVLLLLAFPFLLLLLLGGIFFVFGFIYANEPGANMGMIFQSFNLRSLSGNYAPLDLAEAAVFQYWPIVTGVAVVWVLIGYVFNDSIIHAATGAKAVTREDQPKLYNILENLCISRGLKTPNLYVIDTDEMQRFSRIL